MAKKMHECPNCGYVFSGNERECKYCGTSNPDYTPGDTVSKVSAASKSTTNAAAGEKKSDFSIGLFIVLLIFAWPVAIIYAIWKSLK